MDIIKSYFVHISKKGRVDNYKIITIDKKQTTPYLVTNSQNILSSQSLIKLLSIMLNDKTVFDIKKDFSEMNQRSLFIENVIFFLTKYRV